MNNLIFYWYWKKLFDIVPTWQSFSKLRGIFAVLNIEETTLGILWWRQQLNVATFYKVQHELHAERPSACESRRQNFRQNFRLPTSRESWTAASDENLLSARNCIRYHDGATATTPSREITTTYHSNFAY